MTGFNLAKYIVLLLMKKNKKLFIPVITKEEPVQAKPNDEQLEHPSVSDQTPKGSSQVESVPVFGEMENDQKLQYIERENSETLEEGKKILEESMFEVETKGSSNLFSNISKTSNTGILDNHWLIVCASSIGQSHIKSNIPCQDSHMVENIENGWGISICCDGAGSAKYSHVGANFVAKGVGIKYFKRLLQKNNWCKNDLLPSDQDWTIAASEGFRQIFKALENLSKKNQIEVSSLACTIIVVIYSPHGLLVAHIGDGRAGFCNSDGVWKPMMIPHKGEESNQTVFLTSNWISKQNLLLSNVKVPECRIINEKPTAFAILSDGCESHSFECSVMDNITNKWFDPNLPSPIFFNPIIDNIRHMEKDHLSQELANEKWRQFLDSGVDKLREENDDKTMIIGVLH